MDSRDDIVRTYARGLWGHLAGTFRCFYTVLCCFAQ